MDGHNILDFVDPDIEAKLAELEREEDQRIQLAELQAAEQGDDMDDNRAEAQRAVAALANICSGQRVPSGLLVCRCTAPAAGTLCMDRTAFVCGWAMPAAAVSVHTQ